MTKEVFEAEDDVKESNPGTTSMICAGRPGENGKRNGAPGVLVALGKRFFSVGRGGGRFVFES